MIKRMMKLFNVGLIAFGLIILPAFAYATVEPPKEQLIDASHLVVIATVDDVSTPDNQDIKGRGFVRIHIEKIIKGTYTEDFLTLSISFGGQGKGDLSREEWVKKWNAVKASQGRFEFYLFNASEDKRYINSEIKGWMLTDEWFGVKNSSYGGGF